MATEAFAPIGFARHCEPTGRNDDETRFRILAACFARGWACSFRPRKYRGRREDRVRAAPAVSRARWCKEAHTSIQVQRKHSGLPCAMVLQLITRSPVTGLSCHRRRRNRFRRLDASVGASGPHAFAVRLRRARPSRRRRPPHPAASVRDVAQRPSEWGGTGRLIKVIWVRRQGKFRKTRNRAGAGSMPSGRLRRGSNGLHRRRSDRVVTPQPAFAQKNIEPGADDDGRARDRRR